jgi:hypothetical protein
MQAHQGRTFERFDIDVGNRTTEAMVRDIQTGKATFIRHQSLRITVWRVKCQERVCAAVYDKERKTIVTVIPLEWEVTPGLNASSAEGAAGS